MTRADQPSRGSEPPSPHQPRRPSWRCAACAEAWPCPRRRAELSDEHSSRLHLALYMAAYFGEALNDHPDASAGDLYHRFMGWFREAGGSG